MTNLNDFAAKPNTPTAKWSDEQLAFLNTCVENKIRISYAGLSLLKLPVHDGGGLNRGRHGSNVVKSLPIQLQPVVCRADGTYHPKAVEAFGLIENFDETFKDLVGWSIIPQGKVMEAFESTTD